MTFNVEIQDDAWMAMQRKLEQAQSALNVEHEIQRQILERLGIEWTPGEPFYSLIEDHIRKLQKRVDMAQAIVERYYH